jgi:MFS family permease
MKADQTDRNIALYTIFNLCQDPFLWGPVLITYLMSIGKMSLAEIYFMEATVLAAMIFVEIYSSSWADILGRKKTMLLGSLLMFLGSILFLVISQPLHVWISNIFFMLGAAMISGADEAYLSDTLKSAGRLSELKTVLNRISSWRYVIAGASAILSGYLYLINPRLPVLASLPILLIATVAVAFLKEPKRSGERSHRAHFQLMKLSILFVHNNKAVKWIIFYAALIMVASKIWFFSFNPYFELVALDVRFYGWIFFALNVVAFISTRIAPKIEKSIGEQGMVLLFLAIIVFPLVGMGIFVSQLAALLILFENFSRGYRKTFVSAFINQHLDEKNRATVISIQSAVISGIGAVSLWAFSGLIKIYPLNSALLALGLIVFALGAWSVYQYRLIFRR